ncbi:hypothetical protein J1605_000660 [Eschrichtius robustus]|uniref:Uncharacterized protein n=1 Tax=Eschrichtius robustus TaxID=9764 RepID=A0AB34GJH5_ESCRO|nr:hypothetical protein J1605_000660 [Eschrichtius robustus]
MEEDASLFPKKLLDDAPLVEDEADELEDPEFVLGSVPGEAENKADPGSSWAELRACRRRMGLLAKQQESVAADLAAERAAGNTAAVGRLEAASQRLCSELGNERDLQAKMTAVLQESM